MVDIIDFTFKNSPDCNGVNQMTYAMFFYNMVEWLWSGNMDAVQLIDQGLE